MPFKGGKDVGSYYSPEKFIEDKSFERYAVSLDYSEDFESWCPYQVSIHRGESEGGSTCRALFTFRNEADARKFYDKINSVGYILKILPE